MINLNSKIYSVHTKIYLPATSKLKNIIKHVVYSTSKSKSTVFYHHHLGILHSFTFHQLSAYNGSHLILEQGVLLSVPH